MVYLGEIGTNQTKILELKALSGLLLLNFCQILRSDTILWYGSIIFLSKNNDTIQTKKS